MSKRGENIYKRKDGRWEGRYIKDYDYKGKVQWGYVYDKSYREVRKKLTYAKQSHATKPTTNRKDFNYFCDEWLVLSRNRVKESTYVKYYNIVSHHIKGALGCYLPQNLNAVIIEEFSNELLVNGLAAKTVRDILTVVRAILKHCRHQIGNDFPDIEVIYPKERKKEMRVLSLDEQTMLTRFLFADMDEVKFGVLLALLTGMRIGEVCALKWEDISLKDRIIRINSTMQRLQTLDKYTESHNGQEWEEPDASQDVEENVTSEILVEQFKATLTEKDMVILQMRMEGNTLEEIAEKLGYKNHSGVLKRIRKIGLDYEKFTGVDYGFENRKIT